MKFLAFDIEIANLVDGDQDWKQQRPLGITCAATYDGVNYELWHSSDTQAMSKKACNGLVDDLLAAVRAGYTLVTVNGVGFDFDVLAEESGRQVECTYLATSHKHVDMMLWSMVKYGWPVSLQALSLGQGVAGKMKTVTLKDGTTLDDMGGAKAPELWRAGEFEAVIAYLKQDVQTTFDTIMAVAKQGAARWLSRKGKPYFVKFDGRLPSAQECLAADWPRHSWMTDPITKDGLLSWTRSQVK